jgi:predicted Rossmann fold nucleotide-binding protein DprA/Smf involved in DNA uptake
MILKDPVALRWKDRSLWAHGNGSLLEVSLSALLCSKTCPGAKILEAQDLAQRWRAENRAVISGFHTPVEKECLRTFLRGPQHIVICPARGLDPFQLPADWQPKFTRGELLIVSPFDSSVRRPTKETAEIRTRLVLSLAQSKTIIHASPGGFLSRLIASDQLSQSFAVSKA